MVKINSILYFLFFCLILGSCTRIDKAKLSVLSGYLSWRKSDWNGAAFNFLESLEMGKQLNDEEIKMYSNYGIGSTYLMQNEDISAMNRFKNIKNVKDKFLHSSVLYQSGIVAFKAQDYKTAVILFRQSLELEPNSIDAKINYELSKKYLKTNESITQGNNTSGLPQNNEDEVSDAAIMDLIKKKEEQKWKNIEKEQKTASYDY